MGQHKPPYYWSRAKKNCLYTLKKTYNYPERDEKARSKFIEKLPLYQPEQLIYMDESGLIVMKVILTVGANQVNASTLNDQVMGNKE